MKNNIAVISDSLFDSKIVYGNFKLFNFANEIISNKEFTPLKNVNIPLSNESIGFYKAYKRDVEFILCLNSECVPTKEEDGIVYENPESFIESHISPLTQKSRWFNTLNNFRPMGLPYNNIGKWSRNIINHGLCTNDLVIDSVSSLVNRKNIKEKFSYDNRIIPYGIYFPMNMHNLCIKRKAAVLMYKFEGHKYADIFAGIIAKRICDYTGHTISSGTPYVRRECKKKDSIMELSDESQDMVINEKFWEYVDCANLGATNNLVECYYNMGDHVSNFNEIPEWADSFKHYGENMKRWAELFDDKKDHI